MYILNNLDSKYISEYGEIASGFVEVKKSKFYSYIFTGNDINNFKDIITNIKKDNKKARHVLYAYDVIDGGVKFVKFSNDNEPQGTGVNSIIAMLEKEEVTNYLVVLVRYYGGTKLRSRTTS